jgi:methyl-accepting chemotaxis protein
MNNIKIGVKLIGGFLIVAIIAAVIGIFGIMNLKAIDKADTVLFEKMTVPLGILVDYSTTFQRVRINMRDMIRANDQATIDKFEALIVDMNKSLEKGAEEYMKTFVDKEDERIFNEFMEKEKVYDGYAEEIQKLAKQNKDTEAYAILDGDALAAGKAANDALDKMTELNITSAKNQSDKNTKTANSATTIMITVLSIGVLIAMFIGIFLTLSITGPLMKGVAMMQEMAKGHLGTRLKMNRKDEIGILADAMDGFSEDLQNNVVATVQKIANGDVSNDVKAKDNQDEISPALVKLTENIRLLIADAAMLSKAAVEGKLATRADASKHQGDYRKIVQGVNDCLDSVIGPLNVAAKYVDDISKGNIPSKITDSYNGDFNSIKNNLNQCIDAVNNLVFDAGMLSKAAVEGKLATRADASKHWGDFRKVVQGVNDCLDSVIGPLNVAAKYVDDISKGNIPAKITDAYNGDFNNIKNNLNQCIDAVNNLVTDAGMLSKAAVEGKLATRADATKHWGDFRKVVQGVNDCLDSVIGPLNVAAKYVDDISKGNIPAKISDTYNGDFNTIKNNLNQCIDAVNNLVADAGMLSKAAIDGKLATRADASKHWGDFRKIVQGVDDCLDAVIGPLNVAADYVDKISKGNIPPKITDKYNGDFNTLKNNLNTCIDAVNALVSDAGLLSVAAVEGKLATRADASKHQGDFRKIVQGVDDCLDAVIGPLNVAAKYVDDISKGNIPSKITDTYNGDFNTLKNNLNKCIDAVNALVADAGLLSKAAVDGKLATRADASKHEGDFRKIVQGVDDCLDAVIGPLNVAADYVDKISKGNIPPKITDKYNGDFNTLKNNLNTCIDAVNALVADAGLLSVAAVEGKLATRADAAKHQGDFRKIVQGVDDCLDAVIGPLNVAAKYVDDISKGNMPAKITDNYNGDFNTIKNNLNQCIDAVNNLVKDANTLAQAGVDGRLQTRADASKHNGDFRRIVEGVNMTLDAVIIPINEAQAVMEKVAARDMTARVKGDYKGDLDKIKQAINSAVDNLDTALTQVAEATDQVSSASQQISSGSQSLAQGANEQASSLEEVSSSLEEMASMTKQNAENSNQAKNLAGEANKNADIGAESMAKMSDAINKIKDSSDQTAKIVKTIDEIAMQTNLLALNAAVEAARAGEAGRGFAVVAEEVRNLAQRSAQAAKNTADMISESVKNAEGGVKIAAEVTKSFESITVGVKKVNDLIAEIAAASGEQSQGIEQVNTAVAQMDKVTQQNAANSEESASAAEELSSQSEELAGMVAQFALTQSTQKRPVVTAARQTVQMGAPAHKPMIGMSGQAKSNGRKPAPRRKVESVSADDVIPMDDEVLKEF